MLPRLLVPLRQTLLSSCARHRLRIAPPSRPGVAAFLPTLPTGRRRRIHSSSSSSSSFSPNDGATAAFISSSSSASASSPSPQQNEASPPRHSPYMGVHWHRANKQWIAEVRHQGTRVLYKSFADEREAALAVDEALRQKFGDAVLTNFHQGTGVFLDPRQAFIVPADERATHGMDSTSSSSSSTSSTGVSFVQALGKYKAVIKQHGRPLLLGLYPTKTQALEAIKDKIALVGKGGMAEAPKQSPFLGVSWDTHHKKWTARLHHEGVRVLSQTFKEEMEEDAARVYDRYARRYHGEGALVNFDESGVFLDPKNRVTRVDSSTSSSSTRDDVDYRGVSWSKDTQKWHAQIQVAGRSFNLGYHTDPKQAAFLYDAAAREHHGARARCNFDEQGQRTNVRIKLNNSAGAKAKYVLRAPVGEGGIEGKVRRRREGGEDDKV